MALVGAAKLIARMGAAREGTTRLHVLSLEDVGVYVPGVDEDTGIIDPLKTLWIRVRAPTASWTRVL